jgi:hypothetical protein
MSDKKLELNIVYAPQKGEDHVVYETERARIWHSKAKRKNRINIGMGWYSIKKPEPEDCLLILEPFCVLPRDYKRGYTERFKYVFTWATKAFTRGRIKKKLVEINHPSCKGVSPNNIGGDWMPWEKRLNEIVIIANNKTSPHPSELYSLRVKLADWLHAESKYDVSWYGQIPISKPYYKGEVKSKHKILRSVKFSLCTENSYHSHYSHNYFTEKMPEVWMGGAVPIYMGCFNINRFGFPKNSYMDLRDFVTKGKAKGDHHIKRNQLVTRIDTFNEKQYYEYVDSIKKNVLTKESLFHHISYDRVYEKMIDTLI